MKIEDPAKVAAEAAARAAQRPAPKANPDAGKTKAAPKKTSVVDQVAKAAGVTKKPAAKKTESTTVKKATSASGASSEAPVKKPATEAGSEPVKKFKKKGIVIFKGNAND